MTIEIASTMGDDDTPTDAYAHARLAAWRGSSLAEIALARAASASKSGVAADEGTPTCATPPAMLAMGCAPQFGACASVAASKGSARAGGSLRLACCWRTWRPSLFQRLPWCIASICAPCCAKSSRSASALGAFEILELRSGASRRAGADDEAHGVDDEAHEPFDIVRANLAQPRRFLKFKDE